MIERPCGNCRHFREDTREHKKRRWWIAGYCAYPAPMWAWDKNTSEVDSVTNAIDCVAFELREKEE